MTVTFDKEELLKFLLEHTDLRGMEALPVREDKINHGPCCVSCAFHGTSGCRECIKHSRLLVRGCDHCNYYLEYIEGCEPYSVGHLQCPNCDSTYVLEEKE